MKVTDLFHKLFYGSTDKLLVQFVRYFFVGGFAFVVDFGLLYILTEYAGLHYLLSATLSFIAGLLVNYIISCIWVFSTSKFKNRLQFTAQTRHNCAHRFRIAFVVELRPFTFSEPSTEKAAHVYGLCTCSEQVRADRFERQARLFCRTGLAICKLNRRIHLVFQRTWREIQS